MQILYEKHFRSLGCGLSPFIDEKICCMNMPLVHVSAYGLVLDKSAVDFQDNLGQKSLDLCCKFAVRFT